MCARNAAEVQSRVQEWQAQGLDVQVR